MENIYVNLIFDFSQSFQKYMKRENLIIEPDIKGFIMLLILFFESKVISSLIIQLYQY